MIGGYPIVSFDTSSFNRLVEDGYLSEPIFAAIKSGLFFRFAGLSIGELIACPNPTKRAALRACCGRLQDGQSDCIHAHSEMLKLHITAHKQNHAFDWKTVNVRAREYERAIQQRTLFLDDELAATQLSYLRHNGKEYDQTLTQLRPMLESICKAHGEAPPPTFREAAVRAGAAKPNLLLGIGKQLYDSVAGTDTSEEIIKQFIDACPPFRATIYGLLMRWFHRALRNPQTGQKYAAGCNDLFMAAHLPYCNKFVTAEKNREQEKCLREIVAVAGLDTEILSYDDFCNSFVVVA
jgi:hypothetical protein